MTELTALVGTVYVGGKRSDGNYGNEEYGLHLQFQYAPGTPEQTILQMAHATFEAAKAQVANQLGESEQHTTNVVAATFGGGAPVAPPSVPPAVAEVAPAVPAPAPAAVGGVEPPADKDAFKAWALARLASNPEEFYDNRQRKASGEYKANSPDFKHKASGRGVWL